MMMPSRTAWSVQRRHCNRQGWTRQPTLTRLRSSTRQSEHPLLCSPTSTFLCNGICGFRGLRVYWSLPAEVAVGHLQLASDSADIVDLSCNISVLGKNSKTVTWQQQLTNFCQSITLRSSCRLERESAVLVIDIIAYEQAAYKPCNSLSLAGSCGRSLSIYFIYLKAGTSSGDFA